MGQRTISRFNRKIKEKFEKKVVKKKKKVKGSWLGFLSFSKWS
jgi:hypothetical protein